MLRTKNFKLFVRNCELQFSNTELWFTNISATLPMRFAMEVSNPQWNFLSLQRCRTPSNAPVLVVSGILCKRRFFGVGFASPVPIG